MAGYQFIHFENYARKCRSEKKGRTVQEIFDEVERVSGNMPHVRNPRKPIVLDGCSIEELRAEHDQVEDATQTQKNGRARKIRSTQNTLATCVMSYPVPVAEIRTDDQKRAYAKWRRLSLEFIKRQWGEDFRCAVQHTDEKFPHLHCYALRKDFDASKSHPGLAAAATSGLKGREAGKVAIDALRAVQDAYSAQVGHLCGQTRLGPGKRRLSRSGWKAEQAQYEALEHAEARAEKKIALEFGKKSFATKISLAVSAVKGSELEDAREEGREELEPEIDKLKKEKGILASEGMVLKNQVSKLKKALEVEYAKPPYSEAETRYMTVVQELTTLCVDNGINPTQNLIQIAEEKDCPDTVADFIQRIIEMIANMLGLKITTLHKDAQTPASPVFCPQC